MKLLADLHISPRTVEFLRSRGHDVLRANDVLPATASDEEIVEKARAEGRAILTQDLDFSAIIALARTRGPSLITLRLSTSKVDLVNGVLERVLPVLETEVEAGVMVTVEDQSIRSRDLPLE